MNEHLLLLVFVSFFVSVFVQKYNFASSYDVESKNGILEFGTYFAPPLDLLIGPYGEKAAATEDDELNLKLLYLLENPDCWFNQRGKSVLLLFNETKFPEEYAILRRSKGLFSGKTKFEMDLQILEEEEDRERLFEQQEDLRFERNILRQMTGTDPELFEEERELSPKLSSKLESSIVFPVNDTLSEDIEKFNYKLRIRKLLNMKQDTLNKMRKVNLELSYLNSAFTGECDDPECDTCLDYQSSINLKHIERNKLRNRFKRVIGLLREFVDHSNKFVLEEELRNYIVGRGFREEGRNLDIDILGQFLNERKTIYAYRRRPGYNTTSGQDNESFDLERNYLKIKELLDELERKTSREDEYSYDELESYLNKQDNCHCESCKERVTDCSEKELEHLLKRREELKQVVMGVRFFLESLSERDCSKCNEKTFNGFTEFTDMINTQIRTLNYYSKIGDKIDLRIDDCMEKIDNKRIILSDKMGFKGYWDKSSHAYDEHSRILERIYRKYKIYNKSYPEFKEKLFKNSIYGGIHNHSTKGSDCDINILVLMNEYKKELIGKVITNEIEIRNSKNGFCESCSLGSPVGCKCLLNNPERLLREVFTYKTWISSIVGHLRYCNYDDMMTFSEYRDEHYRHKKNNKIDLYFGEDGILWSLERYSSESFINRVLSLKGLLRVYRLKILERIKLTLMTLIKTLALSYPHEASKAKCTDCKYGTCNDCFRILANHSQSYIEESRYLRLLSIVRKKIWSLSKREYTSHKSDAQGNFPLIKRNSLKYWKPREVRIMLKCNEMNYSRAYLYFRELEDEIKMNRNTMDYFMETIFREASVPMTEFQLMDLVKEWDRVWNDTNMKRDAFKLLNGFLSNCIKYNAGFDNIFNEYTEGFEIEKLNNSFRDQSRRIDRILAKLREISGDEYIDFNEKNYPDFEERVFKVNRLMQNLDSEFRVFDEIRKRLNSNIYRQGFNNLELKNKDTNIRGHYRGSDKGMIGTRRYSTRVELPNGTLVEEFEKAEFPIPGMRKYLEMLSDSHNYNDGKKYKFLTSKMKPNSKYSCTKIEILVLQKVTSVLSQNYKRLEMYMEGLKMTCKRKECVECILTRQLSDTVALEKNIIKSLLGNSTIQLSQCILDTQDDYISKEEYIEFQNSLRMQLTENSSFNSAIGSRFKYIRDYKCDKVNVEELINIKNNVVIKLYSWIEKVLTKMQVLDELDENHESNVLKYKSITYQFVQLVDYSKYLEDKINNCLSLLNVMLDHGFKEG